jgi:hypothetical protein
MPKETSNVDPSDLLPIATTNSQLWADLMWISGGNLQLGKCFYYAFTPTMDFKSNSVKYKKITSVSGISIINPADGKRTNIAGLQPSDSRRTLGVLLSPDGKGINQLKVTLSKAKEFFGKFMNSSHLQKQNGWL